MNRGPRGGAVCLTVSDGAPLSPRLDPIICQPPTLAACYDPANVGTIGQVGWTGCEGMLIVDNAMLRGAGAQGDETFAILGPDTNTYTFADSAFNVFTGQVTDMTELFMENEAFAGDIGYWDTSNVTTMRRMFAWADAFNQDIGGWDTSEVTDMSGMFLNATLFSRNLSRWCVAGIEAKPDLFDTSSGFAGQAPLQPQWGTCPSPLALVSITLEEGSPPNASVGSPYIGFDFAPLATVTGAEAEDLIWIASGLPAGMGLSWSGLLTGTPSGDGTYAFTVTAAHSAGASQSRSYTILVDDSVTVTLLAGGVPDATRGAAYSFDMKTRAQVDGGSAADLSWAISGAPPWLSLSASGDLTGTPTDAGAFSFTVAASHSGGASDSEGYTLIVNDTDPLIIEP